MAGSRRQFAYFTDEAEEMWCSLDESVYESTDLGFAGSVTPARYRPLFRIKPSSHRPFEMRYIMCSRLDADQREIKRKFYVGSTTAAVWGTATSAVIDGETWQITSKHGEVRHYAPLQDTGQIDGDVDNNTTAPAG